MLKSFFKRLLAKPRVPQPGELWRADDDSPFPPTLTDYIYDVREGWVLYSTGGASTEVDTIKNFIRLRRFYRAKL